MDGSCRYTETKDKKPVFFDFSHEFLNLEFRNTQLLKREQEVIGLIDELHQTNFLQSKLDFPQGPSIDLDKLTMSGHSYGGITAVGAAAKDPRIKVCLPMDAWLLGKSHQIHDLKLPKTPLLNLVSSTWFSNLIQKNK